MNSREAWDLAGKAAAALIVAIVVATIVILSVKQSADQPMLPLVSAGAGCAPANPCATMNCEVRKGPFGGVDMDAGERDNRRIA